MLRPGAPAGPHTATTRPGAGAPSTASAGSSTSGAPGPSGPSGALLVEKGDGVLDVQRPDDLRESKALHGLSRT
ncbi:hypothetical protein ABLM29_19890, partial [Nocardioides sp. YIM 152588]